MIITILSNTIFLLFTPKKSQGHLVNRELWLWVKYTLFLEEIPTCQMGNIWTYFEQVEIDHKIWPNFLGKDQKHNFKGCRFGLIVMVFGFGQMMVFGWKSSLKILLGCSKQRHHHWLRTQIFEKEFLSNSFSATHFNNLEMASDFSKSKTRYRGAVIQQKRWGTQLISNIRCSVCTKPRPEIHTKPHPIDPMCCTTVLHPSEMAFQGNIKRFDFIADRLLVQQYFKWKPVFPRTRQ